MKPTGDASQFGAFAIAATQALGIRYMEVKTVVEYGVTRWVGRQKWGTMITRKGLVLQGFNFERALFKKGIVGVLISNYSPRQERKTARQGRQTDLEFLQVRDIVQ